MVAVDGMDDDGNDIGGTIYYDMELSGTYDSNDVTMVSATLNKRCTGSDQICDYEKDCTSDISDAISW